jgi:hypothetical protein
VCENPGWASRDYANGNIPDANFKNPPIKLKDTIFIPVGGYVVVRFMSDNPGYWFLHCHIEMHQAEGMALIIQEGENEEIRRLVDFNQLNTCGTGPERNSAVIN